MTKVNSDIRHGVEDEWLVDWCCCPSYPKAVAAYEKVASGGLLLE